MAPFDSSIRSSLHGRRANDNDLIIAAALVQTNTWRTLRGKTTCCRLCCGRRRSNGRECDGGDSYDSARLFSNRFRSDRWESNRCGGINRGTLLHLCLMISYAAKRRGTKTGIWRTSSGHDEVSLQHSSPLRCAQTTKKPTRGSLKHHAQYRSTFSASSESCDFQRVFWAQSSPF